MSRIMVEPVLWYSVAITTGWPYTDRPEFLLGRGGKRLGETDVSSVLGQLSSECGKERSQAIRYRLEYRIE